MKRFVIGDIHGCYDELQALLDKVGLSDDDEIISIGDMVDRGLDSPACLNFFREMPNTHAVMGNHERKHVRAYFGELKPAKSQIIARHQFGEDAYPDAIRYMADLPRYIDLPEAILVHGFYEPGYLLDFQRVQVLVGTLGGEQYLQRKYDRPWYDLYDRAKPIIVGHRNYTMTPEPTVFHDKVFALDTSCVYGWRLTGLLLPDFTFYSVPSKREYWSMVKEQYAEVLRDNGYR